MKLHIALVFSIFLSSCFLTKQHKEAFNVNIPKDLQLFLQKVETAAVTHNKENMLQYMDDEYLLNQHDHMLDGRTDQFLNELFCGYTTDHSNFVCPGFDKIKTLKLVKIENNKDLYTVYYSVHAGNSVYTVLWTISIKETESGIKYGIYGTVG